METTAGRSRVGLPVAILASLTPACLTPTGLAALATATLAAVRDSPALPMAVTSLLVPVGLVATDPQRTFVAALAGF